MSAKRVNPNTRTRSSKTEEAPVVFAEISPRRPVKGGGSGGWKTEETPIFAEVLPRIPVKGGGRGGWKNEEASVLAEVHPPRPSAPPLTALLEAHRNLRRFH